MAKSNFGFKPSKITVKLFFTYLLNIVVFMNKQKGVVL